MARYNQDLETANIFACHLHTLGPALISSVASGPVFFGGFEEQSTCMSNELPFCVSCRQRCQNNSRYSKGLKYT